MRKYFCDKCDYTYNFDTYKIKKRWFKMNPINKILRKDENCPSCNKKLVYNICKNIKCKYYNMEGGTFLEFWGEIKWLMEYQTLYLQ